MKKRLSVIGLSLFVISTPVLANQFPNNYWPAQDGYVSAAMINDEAARLKYAQQIVSIMINEPASEIRTNALATYYDHIARLSEKNGDYTKALEAYINYIPYAVEKGWTDGINYAKHKIKILEPHLEIYQMVGHATAPYFGAKFEPTQGILYGSVYDSDPSIGMAYNNDDIRAKYPNEESILLTYLEFGQDISDKQAYFDLAKEQGKVILLAWNTYGSSLENLSHQNYPVTNVDNYINQTLDYISEQDVPVLLRFGTEMNVGENGADATAYVDSFRYIASTAKQLSNIAMVWAPNDVGAIDRPFENYYPGDEFVDWVGLSLYPLKYFGNSYQPDDTTRNNNETFFLSGENANPLLRVERIVDFMTQNNIQKPIIISETGAHHYNKPMQEDTTTWAINQMHKTYGELLKYYPQIKGICYFNVDIPEDNIYNLFTNPAMLETYNALVSDPIFITQYGTTSPISYKNISSEGIDKDLPLVYISTSAYYPFANDVGELMVQYSLDEQIIYQTIIAPYSLLLEPEHTAHANTLKIETIVSGELKQSKEINFY